MGKKTVTRGAQLQAVVDAFEEATTRLRDYASNGKVNGAAISQLEDASTALRAAMDEDVYQHALPQSIFNPADSRMYGQFAALALVAQARELLGTEQSTFGGGIYAIYYNGPFADYAPLVGTETPIYVGKAQSTHKAKNLYEQGTALTGRLAEHVTSISAAKSTLNLSDFESRRLVVAPGWEASAESALISLFNPIWNSPRGPVHGIGKHGDKAHTRKNKRSPWDTLHPGRAWAAAINGDQKSAAQIKSDVQAHFQTEAPLASQAEVLAGFLRAVGDPR